MRKTNLRLCTAAMSALLVLCLIITSTACVSKTQTAQERVSAALGLELSSAEEVKFEDNHGGFHGDGAAFITLHITDPTFYQRLDSNPLWHSLPLDDPMTVLLYGVTDGEGSYGPYLTDSSGAPLFPQVEKGYYFINDRHPTASVPYSSSAILGRSSLNLTAAVYDAETQLLYFCEFDT